jgi:hypothetical protein
MGKLSKQDPRKPHGVYSETVVLKISELLEISNETKISLDQVIKIYEVMVRDRANNLYLSNADIHDEQMSGFGKLFVEFLDLFDKFQHKLFLENINVDLQGDIGIDGILSAEIGSAEGHPINVNSNVNGTLDINN